MKVGEQALYLAQLKGLSRQEPCKRLKFWFGRMDIMPAGGIKKWKSFQKECSKKYSSSLR
jgi:ABC-type uncharacterized transport system ATPase subunit